MIRLAVALILLALILPAFSHSFYPRECCSGTDCAPLAASRVQVTPAGYLIDGRETIPFRLARWSPDSDYHGCFPATMQGRVGCFWAPRQAM